MMTNIGAIALQVNKKSKGIDHLVFVADSMGSNVQERQKGDHYQKLFQIGNHLMMGTGPINPMFDTAADLSQRPPETSAELAEEINKLNFEANPKKRKDLNFILGGPNKDSLGLFRVITKTGHIHQGNVGDKFFDGSGFTHVFNYAQSTYDAGHRSILRDVADSLVMCFDLGKQGAKDMGVNDKMMYGIISPNGVSTLYHPEIYLITNVFIEQYAKGMTGIDAQYTKKQSKRQEMETLEKFRASIYLLRNFYNALHQDLRDYSSRRINFTSVADDFANGKESLKKLKQFKAERQQAKCAVELATASLMSRGVDNLLTYQHDFDARKLANENKASLYQKEQKT